MVMHAAVCRVSSAVREPPPDWHTHDTHTSISCDSRITACEGRCETTIPETFWIPVAGLLRALVCGTR